MINFVLPVMTFLARQAKADFVRKTTRAEVVQTRFLKKLLQAHQYTEFGLVHDFSSIRSIEEFQARIPVAPYSDFEHYTQRIANGERNVLTADPVIFMNTSSGSTGKQKLIPVTKRSRRMIARANQVAMGFLFDAARDRQLPLGQMLFTNSTKSFGQTPGGIAYGPISTSDLRLTNSLYRQIFSYPFEALELADIGDRHYVCLLFALRNRDLRVIGATFPVLALRLADNLERHAEDLIHDLQSGTIASWVSLEPEQRQVLETYLKPAPQRADELRDRLRQRGRLTPIDVWPDLSVMVTARAGTSDFYFQRFPEYFGETPVFGGTYASAEGTYGVHQGLNTDSVILALESGFYEFIPEDQWDRNYPDTVLPWQVRVGDRYRIVMSNYSGLYRYDVGDVVEIEGFEGLAPHFTFRHRRSGVISSTTEKTTEFHVTQVVQTLQQDFNLKLENFCVTLSDDAIPAAYQVNIELAPGHGLHAPEAFLHQFDRQLMALHPSYAVKRLEGQVPAPRLRILTAGSFAQLRQQMVARGAVESQLKFPLVTEDRTWLQGLSVERDVQLNDEGRVRAIASYEVHP